MKKRILIFPYLLSFLLLSLACNLSSLIQPDVPLPEGAEETAQAVLEQVPEVIEQGEDAAATLQAVAGDFTLEDLKELFSSVQLDGSGNASVTVTEEQINKTVQSSSDAAQSGGEQAVIEDVHFAFTGGNIVMTGKTVFPPADLRVVFRPYVENGVVRFEVAEASLGPLTVPEPVMGVAEAILNETLGASMNSVPDTMTVKDIIVGEGTLTVVIASG